MTPITRKRKGCDTKGIVTQSIHTKKVRQRGGKELQPMHHRKVDGSQNDDVAHSITAAPAEADSQGYIELENRIEDLQAQLEVEKALRKQLALQHRLNPDPNHGILDALPIDIVSIILEQLLVKEYPLHLNDLLVKFREDNICRVGGFYLGVRRPLGGYDWQDLETGELASQLNPVVEGKFEYDENTDRWIWLPSCEYKEFWDVINTCQVFRREGLNILLTKNTWVISPIWTLTKSHVQRYWCVKLGKYEGPWSGNNGLHNGIPAEWASDFALPSNVWDNTGDLRITSAKLVRELTRRPLQDHEYMSVPKGLLGLERPLELIKHIRIGLPVKAHIPSDAAHFLKETLQFLASYREFSNLESVTWDIRPSWRTTYEHDWGCMSTKDDTVEALKTVLADYPVWAKNMSMAIKQGNSKEVRDALYDAATLAESHGSKSIYPKTGTSNSATNNTSVLLKNGHIRVIDFFVV